MLLVLLAVCGAVSRAGGLIVIEKLSPEMQAEIVSSGRVRPPRMHFPLAALEVASEQVDAKIRDQVATVSIEQEFYNPNAQQLEGTFLFPIPKGAHLDKFRMEVGGKMMEPELLSAEKARRIYEEIVRAAKDPALMEFQGRDLLKVRIFPIEPHSRKKVALSYTQVLKADDGLLSFRIPIAPEKYSAKAIEKVSVNVELEASAPLKTVYSPSHWVEVNRPTARRASVRLNEKEMGTDRDFQLIYGFEKSEVELKVLTHRGYDGEGYFMLFGSPGIEAKENAVVAKDVAFVLDTSGSMSGAKIEQARKALLFCVRNLNEADRFEVIRFSTDTEPLFRELRPASKENLARAESFIGGLKALNGTAIDDALREALELRKAESERPFVVVFLTDGLPTVGETRVDKIVANAKERAGSARVFCFGIGSDVNTHLLDKIAEETRAFSTYVTASEDIEVKVSSFFSKIRDPLLASVKIDVDGSVRLTKQYPSALPDLFKGEQLIVAGRYFGSGKATVTLSGKVNGTPKTFKATVDFPERDEEHDFIPRVWATRRVGALLDQIRLNGENAELKDEVTELARKYGIVTPYTAYLIMEDEVRRGVPTHAQTMPKAEAMPMLREEAKKAYDRYRKDQVGELAVQAAQESQQLRQAQQAAPKPIYMTPPPASRAAAGRVNASPAPVPAGPALLADELQQPSRFAAGRAFYQNGKRWVDTDVQKAKGQKEREIRFNSPEYFEFAAKNPDLAPILSLGQEVQFVHQGSLITVR